MRVRALRGTLRQGSQLYGVQQTRILYNARKCDRGIPRVGVMRQLLLSVSSLANKGWARPVPAAAVIPAPQVVVTFIGPKASVAGQLSFQLNLAA